MLAAQDRQSSPVDQDAFLLDSGNRGRAAHREVATGPSHAGCMDTNRASRRCEDTPTEGYGLAIGQEPSVHLCSNGSLPFTAAPILLEGFATLTFVQEAPHDDSGAKSCVGRQWLRRRVCFWRHSPDYS